MAYDPQKHRRRSIRLKGYDYATPGAYFVTICVQDRKYLFGKIAKGQMILNNAGKMVERWYHVLENKFANVKCDEYMVMPNHFHCILQIVTVANAPVGADQRVCPNTDQTHPNADHPPTDGSSVSGKTPGDGSSVSGNKTTDGLFGLKGEHVGSPLRVISPTPSVVMGAALPRVMQWFKTMTTNEYIRNVKQNGWPRFDKKLWQRDYYEHIVRNDIELNRIRKYIRENPKKWDIDRENRF